MESLRLEMDAALQFPGVSNAWTMPIKARIDMLSTGIRTPVGIKVVGHDLSEMENLARKIEAAVRTVPGTTSAYAERAAGGSYLNIDPNRERLARYGLMVGDVQNVIATALGANPVTTTVEGRERYKVAVRYPRDYRSNPQAIANEVLIPIAGGGTVPLSEVAKVSLAQGPSMIRTENAQLALYIFVDFRGRDIGSYGGRPEGGRGAGRFPARLLRDVERPVRVSATRREASADRRSSRHHHLRRSISILGA